ncbi:MAG: nucleoside 2-deoxyribosyltransferase [Anaerolineales bacterium]|nr:MAG: nucleoside 2-deoxyribosyltransferase [Anaerolineales bacterium]
MKVYLAIKYHADHANRARIEGITAVIEALGHKTICVTRDLEQWGAVSYTPDVLMARSFDAINACGIMVVDLTEKGVGVGIEAGYAYAREMPIITIAQADAPLSTTLRGISMEVFSYSDYNDLTEYFIMALPAAGLDRHNVKPDEGLT